jgi:hypothetical protein
LSFECTLEAHEHAAEGVARSPYASRIRQLKA